MLIINFSLLQQANVLVLQVSLKFNITRVPLSYPPSQEVFYHLATLEMHTQKYNTFNGTNAVPAPLSS